MYICNALQEAGLFRWCVAPLLDDGFLDFPGVGLGSGANLLGNLSALLSRHQLGHDLGDETALGDGLHVAGLHRVVHHDGLHFIPTTCDLNTVQWLTEGALVLTYILKPAALRPADLLGLRPALGLRRELLDDLPLYAAPLHRPLLALVLGDVALRHLPALHHLLRLAVGHVVLHLGTKYLRQRR